MKERRLLTCSPWHSQMLFFFFLFSVFNTTHDYLPRGGTAHSVLGPSTSIISQGNTLQACFQISTCYISFPRISLQVNSAGKTAGRNSSHWRQEWKRGWALWSLVWRCLLNRTAKSEMPPSWNGPYRYIYTSVNNTLTKVICGVWFVTTDMWK